jgi:hypothetical protein
MRTFLESLARQTVRSPVEEDAYAKAYEIAETEVLRCYRSQYPKSEMKVLAKYGMAVETLTFYVIALNGDGPHRFDSFTVTSRKYLNTPNVFRMPRGNYGNHRVKLDEKASKAWNDYESAKAAREKARHELLDQFITAARNARTLEEIEAVWPKAKEARALVRTLPVVQVASALEAMRQAVEDKLA